MERKILYIDCDGVVFNTIEEAFRMMKEMNMDTNIHLNVHNFFISVDWNILISRAGIINDAIIKIKKIINNNIFKDVIILTKTSGNLEEEGIKRRVFSALLPGVKVITVDFCDNKDEIVDPKGNILVDDSNSNIKRWIVADGIGIIFDKDNIDYENNIINDLEDINKTAIIRKLEKVR